MANAPPSAIVADLRTASFAGRAVVSTCRAVLVACTIATALVVAVVVWPDQSVHLLGAPPVETDRLRQLIGSASGWQIATAASLAFNVPLAVLAWAHARQRAEALRFANAASDSEQLVRAESKAAQERLSASEERLRLANEAAGIGTFIMDLVTGRVRFSPEAADLLGFKADDEPTIEDSVKQCVHPDDLPPFHQAFLASLDPAGNGRLTMDLRIMKPGGVVRWLTFLTQTEFASTPEGRKPFRQFGTCMDITERKQAQEVLARSNVELEQKVAERTQALEEEMRRRAETQAELAHVQRLDAVGQLTGGLAHHFNNLLTVVSVNLELALPGVDNTESRQSMRNALDAVYLGANLNRRLLRFACQQKLEPELLVINERVQDMALLLHRTLGESINLVTQLGADLWHTRIDPSEIDHAVLNLSINARDAMPSGGTLTIQSCNVTLDSSETTAEPGVAAGDYVHLSLTDTGVGMRPEVLARAIEPFFTTKGPGEGTGLGLSSVYGFVKQSGGFMRLRSTVGVGTIVSLYLPRVIAEPGVLSTVRALDTEVLKGDGELVLVVEDNRQVIEATMSMIEGLGYAVLGARNGPEALSMLQAGEPVALVLSDIVMPGGMSGYDVRDWLLRERPTIRILLASGFNDRGERESHLGAADVAVLRKPYSRLRLAHALHEAMHRQDPVLASTRLTSPVKT